MQRCLRGQQAESTLVYLDDVITFAADFTTHLNHLEEIFRAMERYGLELLPEKCELFLKEVKFLGHCVSSKGVFPDPEKVAVQEAQPPTTVRQVRSFLGFAGYYRRFIKGFSNIAKLLNELLVGTGPPRGRQSPPIVWSPECTAAFQRLKQELLQAPILAYADFTKPFILYTNASNCGLGAVLAHTNADVLSRLPSTGEGPSSDTTPPPPPAPGATEDPVPTTWGWNLSHWQEHQGGDQDLVAVCQSLGEGSAAGSTREEGPNPDGEATARQWERFS